MQACWFPDPSSLHFATLRTAQLSCSPQAGANGLSFGGFHEDDGRGEETRQLPLISSVLGTLLSAECDIPIGHSE